MLFGMNSQCGNCVEWTLLNENLFYSHSSKSTSKKQVKLAWWYHFYLISNLVFWTEYKADRGWIAHSIAIIIKIHLALDIRQFRWNDVLFDFRLTRGSPVPFNFSVCFEDAGWFKTVCCWFLWCFSLLVAIKL